MDATDTQAAPVGVEEPEFNLTGQPAEEVPVVEPKPEVEAERQPDIEDVIEPRMEPIERVLGPGREVIYYQKPLSFMGRWEFFALLGDTVTKLMDSEQGVTLAALLEQIGVQPGAQVEDELQQAEVLMKGFARLTSVAPELIDECFVIWLNIPKAQREGARYLMRQPSDEGGFDDDTGWDIIEAFIEQNAEEIISFFTDRLPQLISTSTRLREFADHRRSSRRLRRSQLHVVSP